MCRPKGASGWLASTEDRLVALVSLLEKALAGALKPPPGFGD